VAEARKFASFDPAEMKEGSNLFDNVRGTIKNIQLTKELPDNYQAEGNPIFGNLTLVLNGEGPEEDRTVTQGYSLGASAGDNFEISEDGYSLYPTNDDATLRKDSKFGTLLSSLKNEGVPATVLASGTLKSLIGIDGQWKRVADKERSFGADRPGRKQSKFPPTTLVCVKLFAMPGQSAGSASAPATPAAPAASSADTGDLNTATTNYLLEVLAAAKDNKIQRANLTLALTKAALGKNDPRRTEIAKLGADETFLKGLVSEGLIKYDAAAKPQVVYSA
jgi:hypothetical protein